MKQNNNEFLINEDIAMITRRTRSYREGVFDPSPSIFTFETAALRLGSFDPISAL